MIRTDWVTVIRTISSSDASPPARARKPITSGPGEPAV